MFRILKKIFKIDLIKKIGVLEKEKKELKEQIIGLKFREYEVRKDPRSFIESILKSKIDWFDYKKLDGARWNEYFNDAQFIIKNETFNNELYHWISDLIKFAAVETKTIDEVLHVRTRIINL